MARSEIGTLIDRIVAQSLLEPLKRAGFRRSGRTWRRRLDGVVQVLQVQASRQNSGADGKFTLNAGVYFPALAARLAEFPVTDAPAEFDCHVRTRPAPRGDRWWTVRASGVARPDPDSGGLLGTLFGWLDRRADAKAEQLNATAEREVREVTQEFLLPWLERMSGPRAARDELARRGQFWLAALASVELGERDEASRLFALARARARGEHAEFLEEAGRRHGFLP